MAGPSRVLSASASTLNPAVARAAHAHGLLLLRPHRRRRDHPQSSRHLAAEAEPGRSSCRSAAWPPASSRSPPTTWRSSFDELDEVRLRVGALPQFPTNEMKYNLTWSTDGLINEYGNPCEAIHDGRLHRVLPLEGLEHFSLDGVDYEAFNTSGGVGTLCETLAGKVRTLNYKTDPLPRAPRPDGVPDERAAPERPPARCSRTSWKTPCRSRRRTSC